MPLLAPDTLTVAEAAERLGIHLEHCRRLMRQGRIQGAYRDNQGIWRVHRTDFDQYWAARTIFRGEKEAQ